MPPRNAILLTFDGLNAAFTGPYGNTWIETPGFNRLAAESLLIEYPIIESPSVTTFFRSFCRGCHAMVPETFDDRHPHLCAVLAEHGINASLITDDAQITQSPLSEPFSNRLLVEHPPEIIAASTSLETSAARLMAAALDQLHASRGPNFAWLHAAAMHRAWDAPPSNRREFADLDDPICPDFVLPPNQQLRPDSDPDQLLAVQHAYAGEIRALDANLDDFLDVVSASAARDETLLIVTSPRGYALGEHLVVGGTGDTLFTEVLQVPLIIRFPDATAAAVRAPTLCQPYKIHRLLREWLVDEDHGPDSLLTRMAREEPLQIASRACSISTSHHALRTAHWSLRTATRPAQPLHTPNGHSQLYLKPDDARDVNDVSDRCPDIAEEMRQQLDAFIAAAHVDQIDALPELPKMLVHALP